MWVNLFLTSIDISRILTGWANLKSSMNASGRKNFCTFTVTNVMNACQGQIHYQALPWSCWGIFR